jgi:hypothetical protein
MLNPTARASICALDDWRDYSVRITFRPVDPLGVVEVVIDPEPSDDRRLMRLVEAAIVRLMTYRRDFLAAAAEDAAIPYCGSTVPSVWQPRPAPRG